MAAPQFGNFTWHQAELCGYPPATLSRWAAEGSVRKVHPSVYTRELGPPSVDGARAAALLATTDTSHIVQRAALDVHECSRFRSKSVQIGVTRRPRAELVGVEVFLSHAAARGHVVERGGHRVTSLPWTITDLGTKLQPEQIAHVIEQARVRRRFELFELDDVLALRGRFRGCANVRKALQMYRDGSAGTRSGYEDIVYAWVKELVRHAPLPNVHVVAGDQSFEVDIPFVGRRLCIEVDGPLHDDPAQQRRDRVRDAALRAAGYRVVRIHWRDIKYRPSWCRALLRELLAST